MNKAETYAEEMSKKYPHLEDRIQDLYYLYCDEVASGESEENEYSLMVNSIAELITEEA